MNYPSIRIEGQIFSGEILQRLDNPDTAGQRPVDFGFSTDVKVKDEIASAWAAGQSYYRTFRQKIEKSPLASLTTETRNIWIVPFMSLLGYKPEFARKGEEINGKNFAISHRDESRDNLPIHILGWNDSLDKKRDDGSGPRMSPHALLQEYLNLSEHLYSLTSNGRTLRLLRDSTRLVRQSYIEFNLETMFEEDVFADFAVMFRLIHATRLPASVAAAPQSLVEKYHQDALDQGARIRDGLRDAVEQALVLLGTGFLSDDAIRKRVETGPSGADHLSPKDYYHHLLQLVYRLLFLLVAEERGLIFPPAASRKHRDIYAQCYSISRLRRLARNPQMFEKGGTDLWQGLLATFCLFEFKGPGKKLGISPLGGHLFSTEALGPLAGARLTNDILLQSLHKLCYFDNESGGKTTVNYGSLATEEFGSVYESLLELHPVVSGQTFSFGQSAGSERKTTGSYYTPDSLVQCLLDSALEPVIDAAIKGKTDDDAASAILKLKVCDPAAGSGHFLLGAAHRMARRLAMLRAHGDEPSPINYRTALRDVISHCIYAVDINPMAVELCKVALWLEAIEPGKPLSFLDHHIRRGNSLLGATPALLAKGIPDDAFDPIEGDDKKICQEAKKRNKSERKGQADMFSQLVEEPKEKYLGLASRITSIDDVDDSSVDGIHRKEDLYKSLKESPEFIDSRFIADAWCAAFFWKKTNEFEYPITEQVFRDIAANPACCNARMRDEVVMLAKYYQFFHWHLVFPDVFQGPSPNQKLENNYCGWNGGFDIIIGNPPWEVMAAEEQEFFSKNAPEIVALPTRAKRLIAIKSLRLSNPALFDEWVMHRRRYSAEASFCHASHLYPLTGQGNLNSYLLFAERCQRLVCAGGRMALILPSAIASGETAKELFQHLIGSKSLISLYDFENREQLFPAIDSRMKFCLLVASYSGGNSAVVSFAFNLHSTDQLLEQHRCFSLTPEDFLLLNPNTRTAATFSSLKDANLVLLLQRSHPVLFNQNIPLERQPWQVECMRMVDLSYESDHFSSEDDIIAKGGQRQMDHYRAGTSVYLPVYEAKMTNQFDHRAADVIISATAKIRSAQQDSLSFADHSDPERFPYPRFWMPEIRAFRAVPDWYKNNYLLSYTLVTSPTNNRTILASIMPKRPAGHSLRLIYQRDSTAADNAYLVAALNSFVCDYICRNKIGGVNLNPVIVNQLPVPCPELFTENILWARVSIPDWICVRVLELSYTAWDLEAFAQDCGWNGPPFRWDEDRRFLLRCELDAAFFHLYGINRDDAAYIMDTFPIVKRRDEEKYGTYRTKDTILEIYDAMAAATKTGKPYQTRLNPPPADPSCCHPKRKVV